MTKISEYRKIFHKVSKRILFVNTRFQNIELIDTDHLGQMIVLDSKTRSSASDEFICQEALVHPAMILHKCVRKVLITV